MDTKVAVLSWVNLFGKFLLPEPSKGVAKMVLLVEVVLVKYSTFPVVGSITSVEEIYLQNLVLPNELCNNDGNQDLVLLESLPA